jgi:hypothetical protein
LKNLQEPELHSLSRTDNPNSSGQSHPAVNLNLKYGARVDTEQKVQSRSWR